MAVEPPRDVDIDAIIEETKPAKPQSSSTKSSSNRIEADDLAHLISALFGLVGQTRPAPLRPAWMITPDDCRPAAEAAARVLRRLPSARHAVVARYIDPALLAVHIAIIAQTARERERMLIHELRRQSLQTGQGAPAPTAERNGAATSNADAVDDLPIAGV